MKVKNLVFFGVAAAILSTAGARAELPVTHSDPVTIDKGKVTSKYYVDSLINEVNSAIPTNNNQLTNGANYITSASVPVKGVQKNGTDLSPDANGKVNVVVPTAVSDLNNDTGFITAAQVPAQVQANWNETNTSAASYINNKPTLGTVAAKDYSTTSITGPEDIATLAGETGVVTTTQLAQVGSLMQTALSEKQIKDSNAQENDIAVFGSDGSSQSSSKQFTTTVNNASTDAQVPTAAAVHTAISTATTGIITDVSGKQDKVTTATEDNIATWNASGNTKDSSKSFTTTVSNASTDAQVPTAAAVYSAIPTSVSQLTGYNVENGSTCSANNPCALVSDGTNIVWRNMAE